MSGWIWARRSPRSKRSAFAAGVALVNDYPETLRALREGRISRRHAEVILEAAPRGAEKAEDGGATLRAAYEHDVLPYACSTTAPRTRAHARAVTAGLQPVTQEEAHRDAREERDVSVRRTADGMAQAIGAIPELLARAIFDRLTAMAATMDDDRTMDQRRADLFCPVHPDFVRSLAGRAPSFARLFLDPSGMVANVDTYVPARTRVRRQPRTPCDVRLTSRPRAKGRSLSLSKGEGPHRIMEG